MAKIRLILGKTVYDPMTAWTDIKTLEIEIPDELKDYPVLGAESILIAEGKDEQS